MRYSVIHSLLLLSTAFAVGAHPHDNAEGMKVRVRQAPTKIARGKEQADTPVPEVPVKTIKGKGFVSQVIAEPQNDSDFTTLGQVNPKLDRTGEPSVVPFPIMKPESGKVSAQSVPKGRTYTEPLVLDNSADRRRWEAEQELSKRQLAGNIFIPIATTSPLAIFSRRNTHPVPKKSIIDGNQRAYQTNKFYSNLYLGAQDRPVFTYPYSVWWSKGDVKDNVQQPFGLSISHVDRSQRVFGPTNSPGSSGTGAIEYYLNPIWIRSMHLGATEFDPATSTMELTQLDQMSVHVLLHADKATNGNSEVKKMMRSPLCLGMGFVSAEYDGLTPVIGSSVGIVALTAVPSLTGSVKYKATLEDGRRWIIYAWSKTPLIDTSNLNLIVVNENRVESVGQFSGLIQIAKLGGDETLEEDDGTVEAVLDKTAGIMCTGSNLSGTVSGSTGTYQIDFSIQRYRTDSELLMYALPHHYQSFVPATSAKMPPGIELTSLAKGMMKAVISNTWTLRETNLPTNIQWLPVKSGSPAVIPAASLTRLAAVAASEVAQDFNTQTALDSMYFSGKAFGKFSYLCLTTMDILNDRTLATTCLNKLKTAYSRFLKNQQHYKLVYEYGWRGIVSDALYQTGDPNVDFGNGHYNDHHFHYGYFIHTAAVIAYLDTRLGISPTWLNANRDWVNTLVRDVANPSAQDPYFPPSRSFDWFHGHSWAKGLFESLDGKDEESSSEDANFAYSMKMWGRISAQPAMEARGNLMLSILNRSINTYILLPNNPTSEIHPPEFTPNKVTGIIYENKVHHVTYFGTEPKHIQGVHMLPLTPVTSYIRSVQFVEEEWNVHFAGKTGTINDGWKGVLYANIAAWLPKSSWTFFNQSGFKAIWLDGGATRTWYMAVAGAMGGA